jgi:GNAT superfamily N-acetyltransferase
MLSPLTGGSFCHEGRSSPEATRLEETSLTEDQRKDAIVYRVDPPVNPQELDELFAVAWSGHKPRDWGLVLQHSLVYVCAYRNWCLVGFVNVAWDGGVHGFILDTTVHPDLRRRGIGRGLVLRAADEARDRKVEWLHVDFEPHLRSFYERCGFRATEAGLIHLGARERTGSNSAGVQHP